MIWLLLLMLLICLLAVRDAYRRGELLWVVAFGLLALLTATSVVASWVTGIWL